LGGPRIAADSATGETEWRMPLPAPEFAGPLANGLAAPAELLRGHAHPSHADTKPTVPTCGPRSSTGCFLHTRGGARVVI
jgi:hypothetical protein